MYSSYQAYVKNGQLITLDASALVPENELLIVTVLGEPIKADTLNQSKASRQKIALEKLIGSMNSIEDEPLGDDFRKFLNENRLDFTREVDL